MYGEGVFITESGGLYLWDNDSGWVENFLAINGSHGYTNDYGCICILDLWSSSVTKIQSPITSTNPSEVCHYFQCVYGPHPRYVVLAEHRCVSTVEFIEENLVYKNILKQV